MTLDPSRNQSSPSAGNIAWTPILDVARSHLSDALRWGRADLRFLHEHLNLLRNSDDGMVFALGHLSEFVKNFVRSAPLITADFERNALRFAPNVILELGWRIRDVAPKASSELLLSAYSLSRKHDDNVSAAHALAAICECEPQSDLIDSMFAEVLSWRIRESERMGIIPAKCRLFASKVPAIESLPRSHQRYDHSAGGSDDVDMELADTNVRKVETDKLCREFIILYSQNRPEFDALISNLFENLSDNNLEDLEASARGRSILHKLHAYDSPLAIVTSTLKLVSLAREEQMNSRAAGMLMILRRGLDCMPDDSLNLRSTLFAAVLIAQGINFYVWSRSSSIVYDGRPLSAHADEHLMDGLSFLECSILSEASEGNGVNAAGILGIDINRMCADALYMRAQLLISAADKPNLSELDRILKFLESASYFSKLSSVDGPWEFFEDAKGDWEEFSEVRRTLIQEAGSPLELHSQVLRSPSNPDADMDQMADNECDDGYGNDDRGLSEGWENDSE